MRKIDGDVTVERLRDGAVRLVVKAKTGELIGVDMSAEKIADHAAAVSEFAVDPEPATKPDGKALGKARGTRRDIVERVTPSVLTAFREGRHSAEEVEAEHVRQTMHLIASRSRIVSDAVAAGTLGMVGAEYALHEGRASVIETLGPVT